MIGSLRGTVLERGLDGEVLLEVAGVGYRVTVPPRTMAELEPTAPAFLYVHHHIREGDQALYGFASREDRTTFATLLAAHGVGPSLAMAVVAVHPPGALRDIVASGDVGALCLVPGVGRKTAERLLVELRNRLDVPTAEVMATSAASAIGEVREALVGLGYATDEIRDALRDLDPTDDSAALLRDALKVLGARHA